ncbi:MAG: carboxypeptidase-like regulatory domain-containing protein [Bacteroidota bacterium]
MRDETTGENLVGAAVFEKLSGTGTASNGYGHYSIQLKSDSVTIIFSYVGYERTTLSFRLRRDTTINVGLKQAILSEVVVNATRAENIQESSSMSRFNIPIEQIKSIPTLMGERDLMKVLQLLPVYKAVAKEAQACMFVAVVPIRNLIPARWCARIQCIASLRILLNVQLGRNQSC